MLLVTRTYDLQRVEDPLAVPGARPTTPSRLSPPSGFVFSYVMFFGKSGSQCAETNRARPRVSQHEGRVGDHV